MTIKIKGMNKVLKNLNREIKSIQRKTKEGVLAAVTFIEGESNEIVPQKTGKLINSSFSLLFLCFPPFTSYKGMLSNSLILFSISFLLVNATLPILLLEALYISFD